MLKKRTIFKVVPLFCILFMLTVSVFAQERYNNQNRHPYIIYGNDPALANNIVFMVDDNVYEGNIRYWFDLFEERGIKATFLCAVRRRK